MKRLFSLFFALLTLSAGLWAQSVGDQFVDETSGLMFKITAVGETNTVKVIGNDYAGTSYTVPATVTYQSKTFAVTEIGDGAFFSCNALQSITLSASVTTIGQNAFINCKALQSIDLSHVTRIEYAAFNECYALQSIDLSHVTTIKSSAFNGCAALQFVTLSENLTTIETGAFSYCKALQSITLPASVTTIGEKAFYYCAHLTDVTVAWTEAAKIPAINANVLGMIANSQGPSGATLHVPDGTKMLYQAAAVWNTFGTFIELAEYKAAAIAEIEQLATDAKTAIDAASAYPSADAIKLDYKAKIDLVIAAATEAINNEASTEAMVDELRDKAMLQINGRKAEALTAIAEINEFEDAKVQAIADITNARQGIQNENLNKWIDGAIKDIQNGGPDATPGIDDIRDEVLNLINFFKDGKAEGKAEGKEEGRRQRGRQSRSPRRDGDSLHQLPVYRSDQRRQDHQTLQPRESGVQENGINKTTY